MREAIQAGLPGIHQNVGVYTTTPRSKSRFHRINAPNQQELAELVHANRYRVAGFLERKGILERDEENRYLNQQEGEEGPMQQVLGCSVSYPIVSGPQQAIYVVMGIVEHNLVRWC